MTFGGEENNSRVRTRDRKFNPALLIRELLISQNAKPQLFGVELECLILISNRDAQKLIRLIMQFRMPVSNCKINNYERDPMQYTL